VEDENVRRRECSIVVGEDRGRERELPSLVAGEGVDEDEEVAAGGGEQSRRVRRELAVGEWPREDERGQAGTEEAGGARGGRWRRRRRGSGGRGGGAASPQRAADRAGRSSRRPPSRPGRR
jgi:hypothetical protein